MEEEEEKRVLTPSEKPLRMAQEFQRQLEEMDRELKAAIAASQKTNTPPSSVSPSVSSMNSDRSRDEPMHFRPQKKESAPVCIVSPSVSVRSDSPDSQLQKTPSEPFSETDSGISSVCMKSDSSMFNPPHFNREKQSEPFSETDSGISSVFMKSDSSMSYPPNFNQEKQRCAVCEEAVKDPVPLPCGHWSCKQCVHSFRQQYGSTADYPCKKCGERSEREKRGHLQSVLLEKEIKRVEMETEKFELEKRKLALEIQTLELKSKYAN